MSKIESKGEILDLFTRLKVVYLSDYIIKESKLLETDPYESGYYLDNKDEFNGLYAVYGEKIRGRELANVYIHNTESKGYGLFSSNTLEENAFIGVYIGVIREEDEMVPFDESGYDTDYAWDYPDEVTNCPLLEVNAKYSGNELRFVNHDSNPNLRVEHTIVDNLWYIFFVADREITANEELTISYGDAYWDTDCRSLS